MTPGDVAVGDEAHGGAGLAHRGDEVGVARAVEDERGDLGGLDALRLGERADILLRRRVEIDHARRVAGSDRDLLHVDVGRVEQRAAFRHRHGGDRAGHVLGAQRGAFERIDGDVDLGTAAAAADLLADEEHRRLVALALPDHHGAEDRQIVHLAPHRIDRRLVRRLLVAPAAQIGGGDRRALGHPCDLQREDAVQRRAGVAARARPHRMSFLALSGASARLFSI